MDTITFTRQEELDEEMLLAVLGGETRRLAAALRAGADPNAISSTPALTIAAQEGFVGCLVLLAEAGADLNALDSNKQSAIEHILLELMGKQRPDFLMKCLMQLCRRGVDLNRSLPFTGLSGWITLKDIISNSKGYKSNNLAAVYGTLIINDYEGYRIEPRLLGDADSDDISSTVREIRALPEFAVWRKRPTHYLNQPHTVSRTDGGMTIQQRIRAACAPSL